MAGTKVNNYSQVDSNILELQLTTDKTFKGYHQLTLTNYDNTTVPAIAAGSAIECNGALYKFDTEEAISTTDPVTSATVADGTVYVCIVPGTTTCTAAFTTTAPTWSDSKQGWYGTGGQANYRYTPHKMTKATTSYSAKKMFLLHDDIDVINSTTSAITTATITTANITTAAITNNNSYYLDGDGTGTSVASKTATGTYYYKLKKTCSVIFRIYSATNGGGTVSGTISPVFYSSSSPVAITSGDPTLAFSFARDTQWHIFHLSPCYFKVSITCGDGCGIVISVFGLSGATSCSSNADCIELIV